MTLKIELPPATLEKLEAEARATGKDVPTLVGEAVEARFAERRRTFAEILKPVHDAVEASGMSESELEKLADQVVAEARAERSASQKPQ
jgi:predicted DNA-binding protein